MNIVKNRSFLWATKYKVLFCIFSIILEISLAAENCTTCRECPAGWPRIGDSCYFFSVLKLNWFRAKHACENMGSHLATLQTFMEDMFVSIYLRNIQTHLPGANYIWMGGSDLDKEGQWKWVTGEPFSYTNWRKGGTNGQIQAPDNDMGLEHCLDWSNGWNDNKCYTDYHFLCEKDICV